jgi:hypothetical protein
MTETREGIDLNELQREAERLTMLLQDRHPGLWAWNDMLLRQAQKLKAILAKLD